jgi:ankyrin repeat protein
MKAFAALLVFALSLAGSSVQTTATILPGGPSQDTALREAAYDLDLEKVRSALQKGANPNAPDPRNRQTPLGMAALANLRGLDNPSLAAKEAGFKDREIVNREAAAIASLLFASGAKLGPNDQSILYVPTSTGNVELVTLLIEKGASINGRIDGYTPTEVAKKSDQEAVYRLLVSRGGFPVERQSLLQLKLVEAASRHDIQVMETATKGGAQINRPDAGKRTALTAAVGDFPIAEPSDVLAIVWLLDHGADPNLRGDGKLPLHEFVSRSIFLNGKKGPYLKQLSEDTLDHLLKAGAKISGVDETGRTPLHLAAIYDMVGAAEILIKEGAKVMPRDKTGKTPLDYAESAAMIRLLKQNGATER